MVGVVLTGTLFIEVLAVVYSPSATTMSWTWGKWTNHGFPL